MADFTLDIVQHIFSILCDYQAARMALVSKKWRERVCYYFQRKRALRVGPSHVVDATALTRWPILEFMESITISYFCLTNPFLLFLVAPTLCCLL